MKHHLNGTYVFNYAAIFMMMMVWMRDIDLFGEDQMGTFKQQEAKQEYRL